MKKELTKTLNKVGSFLYERSEIMRIGEIIKRKDRNTYEKLLKMAGGNNYDNKMDKTKRNGLHRENRKD